MKQSGAEWIGDIPEDWTIRPHWAVLTEKKVPVGSFHNELTLLSLTKQGVIVRDMDAGGKFPASFEGYQRVDEGDLILCLFDVEETPRTVGLSPTSGMITSAYTVMRVSGVDTRFLEWYLIGMDNEKRFKPFYSGLRNVLPKPVFGSIRFAMPTVEEQRDIAAYLDQETSQIDLLISKKEQMIEKLLERRKALITQAVTKGLDPNVPMKNSGVDWIGSMPASWKVAPLWSRIRFSTGWTPPSKVETNFGGGLPWVNISDLGPRLVSSTAKTLSEKGVRESGMVPAKKGSLLFSFKLSIGQVSFANQDLFTNEAIAAFEGAPNLDLHFAYYMFPLAIPANCSWNIYGAKMLNETRIKQARILLPPVETQIKIAEYLDRETNQIEQLVEKTTQAIQILRERRQALITQVVTGKLDIRGFAGGNS